MIRRDGPGMRAMVWRVVGIACVVFSVVAAAAVRGADPATTPAVGAAATAPASAPSTQPGRRMIGYFAEWSKHYAVTDIPAEKLTHINYAFAIIRDGECATKDNLAAAKHFPLLQSLKKKHPHLRTLISVGGWTDSTGFYDAARTPEAREKFAKSAAVFARTHGFDGVDIDWEYPGGGGHDKGMGGPEDIPNFTLLLRDLRSALDAQGEIDQKHYLLTIAAPAGARAKRLELAKIAGTIDYLNLMTYDFAGHWDGRTGFNAPLYNWGGGKLSADSAVRIYLEAGIPREKVVLGVPFYGRAFAGVEKTEHGLKQAHSGKPPRAITSGPEWSWRSLARNYLDKGPTRFWHDEAKVPWLYDKEKGLFVSYDDPESLKLKAAYVREHDLGGVMIWELSQDDAESTLLNAVHAGLRP